MTIERPTDVGPGALLADRARLVDTINRQAAELEEQDRHLTDARRALERVDNELIGATILGGALLVAAAALELGLAGALAVAGALILAGLALATR